MNVLVFLTAYNEEKTIGGVLDRISDVTDSLDCNTEILVIDDASVDSTRQKIQERNVEVVTHPVNLGPGAATRTGYKYAVRNGFDVTVRMDADGQHRPEDIPKLLKPILNDTADIVIGSRYKNETDYETSAVRELGIRFYSRAVSIVTGGRVHDITSGFRAVDIQMGEEHAKNLPSGISAIDRGIREGLSDHRIVEVPVQMKARQHGSSYLNVSRLVKYPIVAFISFIRALLRTTEQ